MTKDDDDGMMVMVLPPCLVMGLMESNDESNDGIVCYHNT